MTDSQTWYAGLAGVVLAAGGLITDPAGRVLLVKPNYRERWALPGGICEHAEPPEAGCRRELAEELGLTIEVGRLLAVDWGLPYGPQTRPTMHFVFDAGQLADGSGIVLQESELDAYRFTTSGELADYLPDTGLRRIGAALRARQSGAVIYVPHQVGDAG
jgi:ADP-ribose pyrophosphatase YjhB (NUDIX family)